METEGDYRCYIVVMETLSQTAAFPFCLHGSQKTEPQSPSKQPPRPVPHRYLARATSLQYGVGVSFGIKGLRFILLILKILHDLSIL